MENSNCWMAKAIGLPTYVRDDGGCMGFCTARVQWSCICCCRWLSQSSRTGTRSCSRNAPRAGWSRAAHRAPPVLSGVATAITRSGRSVFAAKRGPNLDNYKIYKDMPKHKASVLMQARAKCVKIAEFLFRRHVPDVPSPLCSCGRAPETPEHVLLYCPETEENRQNNVVHK
jgi:hypothetical protein